MTPPETADLSTAIPFEDIFYQRIRKFRGCKNRTSAAEYGGVICGTAEGVPFQENRVLPQILKP
jgi:hypothetical protein